MSEVIWQRTTSPLYISISHSPMRLTLNGLAYASPKSVPARGDLDSHVIYTAPRAYTNSSAPKWNVDRFISVPSTQTNTQTTLRATCVAIMRPKTHKILDARQILTADHPSIPLLLLICYLIGSPASIELGNLFACAITLYCRMPAAPP